MRFYQRIFFLNGTVRIIIIESEIAECIYILTKIYKVPRKRAAESLIDILHYKGIANHDRKELLSALTLFAESNIDIVDCILCAKAVGPDGSLFSFDDELNKIHNSQPNGREKKGNYR